MPFSVAGMESELLSLGFSKKLANMMESVCRKHSRSLTRRQKLPVQQVRIKAPNGVGRRFLLPSKVSSKKHLNPLPSHGE